MMPLRRLLALLWLCSGLALAADNSLIPEAASAPGATPAAAQSGRAEHFMAVTANPHATAAAVAMLRRGGSAVDAAIAAQLVLGLVEPQASGIGGGAFMLYWDRQPQRLRYYDGRETAPAAVDENYFLQANGQPLPFFDAVIGGYSVGVPGVVRMLALSHRQHGRLPWAMLFEPAIRLAEHGFAISPRLNTLISETPRLRESPTLRGYLFLPDGSPKPAGTLLNNPAYAKTLRLLARSGEEAFYNGPIARDIVAAVQANPNRPGKLALADIDNYRAREREPLCADYHTYRVCGPAPPSSGGSTVLAILGMLQAVGPAQREPDSLAFYHHFAEASRLAFADRDTYLGDPDFVAIPLAGLVAPDYLAARARLIDPAKAAVEVSPGQPTWPRAAAVDYLRSASPELVSTSHISIVDSFGNALSMTTSVESAFGSRVMVDGFILNNQLTDFSFTPRDQAGRQVANRIQPGKRPRSSMAPMIVFKEGRPVLLLGSPGGARIIDYVAKTLVYILDDSLRMDAAIASPHIIAMGRGVELEQGRVGAGVDGGLEALGHLVKTQPQASGLNGIAIDERGLSGVSDPRREGTVGGE